MNCAEFESVLNELACDRMPDVLVDALARKRALVHAAVCQPCARQLAAQRALNAGLLEFAEATGREQPPLRVKQQLRAALAERKVAPVAEPARVLAFKPKAKPQFGWPRWALAAAAAILLLFTISLTLWRRDGAPVEKRMAGGASPAPQVSPAPAPEVQPRAQFAAQQVTRRRVARPKRIQPPIASEQELASEFVPLTLTTDERALANGTLVRLAVPRARLIAMGLPLRVEAERETVNAEVMMGDNGVAYAIRVVR